MKPKNFPMRKLARKLGATGTASVEALAMARAIRTKKSLIGGSPGRVARHGGKTGRKQ